MNNIKIVIIGAGFAGVYSAKYLLKLFKNNVDITLINKEDYFLFTPLIHEVAIGDLTEESVKEDLNTIFKNERIKIIKDIAIEIYKNNKKVKTVNGEFIYDYLIIAPGAETNYFNTSGSKENTYTLKTLNDAIRIKKEIIENSNIKSCAIIGGGATGVELAGEIIDFKKTYLITNANDLISQFPQKMKESASKILIKKGVNLIFNANVSKIEKNTLFFNNEKLQVDSIIWVAGVKASLSEIKGISIGQKGRIEINKYLQSIDNQYIFSIGDAGGNMPMLAQIAVQQAKVLAHNIFTIVNNKDMKEFNTNVKGLLISLGKWSAIADFKGITLSGPHIWWLWRIIYLFNFNSWNNRFKIAKEWTLSIFPIKKNRNECNC